MKKLQFTGGLQYRRRLF